MQKINTNVFNSLFIEFCNISYLFNSVIYYFDGSAIKDWICDTEKDNTKLMCLKSFVYFSEYRSNCSNNEIEINNTTIFHAILWKTFYIETSPEV